jgi:hypothetical protein
VLWVGARFAQKLASTCGERPSLKSVTLPSVANVEVLKWQLAAAMAALREFGKIIIE